MGAAIQTRTAIEKAKPGGFRSVIKDRTRARAVKPAGSRWLPERLREVRISTQRGVEAAQPARGEVHLKLDDGTEGAWIMYYWKPAAAAKYYRPLLSFVAGMEFASKELSSCFRHSRD